MQIKNICCIGAGYVGGPTMSVIANRCPDIKVNVVDKNEERINLWNDKNLENLPIYEPGLDKIVSKCRGKNLFFSTNISENIAKADAVFISVNTPTKKRGIGAGQASDLKWVEACAREVARFARGYTIVIEKSTLPVRTAEVIKKILDASISKESKEKQGAFFDVLSNPEFLAEGTAINDLENPDRILIGGDDKEAMLSLSRIYKKWVPDHKILLTNIWSSELAKLASNAFLAQRISSINSISTICEGTGADIREVGIAIGRDSRIGSKFLESGPGFGGSCFKKDILNLAYLAEYFGLEDIARYWEGVVNLNIWHQSRISKIIVEKLFGTISQKRIVILGFAFKANTNDTRESASIKICKDLIEEGADLIIHDPKVTQNQIEKELKINSLFNNSEETDLSPKNKLGQWRFSETYDVFDNAHAAVILTEWEDYKNIDWLVESKKMVRPAWIFDSRSIVNPQEVTNAGLNLWRLGDGCSKNKKNDF